MGQAIWTGSISFGLVTIPVRLYPATQPKDVRFHLYDRRTGKRVRYERVTRTEEAPTFAPDPDFSMSPDERDTEPRAVSTPRTEWVREAPAAHAIGPGDVVRGVELPEGDLVTVTEEEFVSLAPERSRTIDLEEFVDLAEIDPVFYEKSYHVAPARRMGAEKPYVLLHRAMREAGMVGIGRFVLRTKPHLVAIRPLEKTLALETLFFGDEVRSPDEFVVRDSDLSVSDREVKTARQLISAMATEWSPSSHADAYREELLSLLRSKSPAAPAPITESTAVADIGDLMAALRNSVEAAKQKQKSKASTSKRAG
ncbi:MAG TPA: Ku protein [Candidatus Limnocylindria bacterium]|jgi:DNA end-binding protein Ku|nr:Ku protein [Candidatus Limnocylindria bacterium]